MKLLLACLCFGHLLLSSTPRYAHAFWIPSSLQIGRRVRTFGHHKSGHNMGRGPPTDVPPGFSSQPHEEPPRKETFSQLYARPFVRNETDCVIDIRGGAGENKTVDISSSSALPEDLEPGTTISTWRDRLLKCLPGSKARQEKAALNEMLARPIQRILVSDSRVLPEYVVQTAAQTSGVIGNPLDENRILDFAQSLRTWYNENGYVLNSIDEAEIEPRTSTARVVVNEPVIASPPINLTFWKEMVVDPESGELSTFRQYKEKWKQKQKQNEAGTFTRIPLNGAEVNKTLVPTGGKTSASRLADVLDLRPGQPFKWNEKRWQSIASSGLFSHVLRMIPRKTSDGSIQLQIAAAEPPLGHVEYGLAKSLYSNAWEGEIDFEHGNFFGGGEKLAFGLSRGAGRTSPPRARLRFADNKLGLEGGYEMEVFGEIVENTKKTKITSDTMREETQENSRAMETLRYRTGATYSRRNPIPSSLLSNSVTTLSAERIGPQSGIQENLGSASLTLGPVYRRWTLGVKSDFDLTFMTGLRCASTVGRATPARDLSQVRPYSSVTATTRQTMPLKFSGAQRAVVAFRHSAFMATRHLPWHVAKANGNKSNIRGCALNDRVFSYVTGTAEVRVPVEIPLPTQRFGVQRPTIVMFGDWLFATEESESASFRKACIGIGLRKSIQSVPLKVDFTYSHDGKFKTSVGLGGDFEVPLD